MSDSIKYVTAGVVCHKCQGSMFEGYWDVSHDERVGSGSAATVALTSERNTANCVPRISPDAFRLINHDTLGYRPHGGGGIIPAHVSLSSLSPFAPTGRRSHRSLKCVQCGTQQEIKR